MIVTDREFAGSQIVLLLGAFHYSTPERHEILRTPPAELVTSLSAELDENGRNLWWFVPCHPIAGATVPRGRATMKPTGVFLSYPSLSIQFDRPNGPVYRLRRAQTASTGTAHGWEVAEIVDKLR